MSLIPFPLSEYQERVSRCRDELSRRGIDVLVETDPANMNYLTGYDGWSFSIPQAVVVTVESEDVLWFGRGTDMRGAWLTTYLDRENVIEWPEHLVDNPDEHPMGFVGEQLAARGLGKKVIAIEHDSLYLTRRSAGALEGAMPNAKFVNAQRLVNWIRLVKSDAEIELMSQAARITERIMQAFYDNAKPGVRECDVIGEVYKAQACGTADFGGGYCSVAPMMPTGSGTATAHLSWSDKKLVDGEVAFLETAGVRYHYHVPMCRTLHLGVPPKKLEDTCKAMVDSIDVALMAAKPGNPAEQVHEAWTRALANHGLTKKERIGYSIGVGFPPRWNEATVSLRAGDKTELKENMTFHMVGGRWQDGWGMIVSEPFRVTSQGGVPFATFPRDLYVKN